MQASTAGQLLLLRQFPVPTQSVATSMGPVQTNELMKSSDTKEQSERRRVNKRVFGKTYYVFLCDKETSNTCDNLKIVNEEADGIDAPAAPPPHTQWKKERALCQKRKRCGTVLVASSIRRSNKQLTSTNGGIDGF